MPRYVAFLRAINVGRHTVKMDRLRALFEALDLRNVKTLIASGNVLFDSAVRNRSALEERIEGHLERALGYEVATFVRTPSELAEVCAFRPSSAAKAEFEARGLYVGFLKAAPSEDTRRNLVALCSDVDALYFNERELYWSCATRMSESPLFGPLLGKTLKMPMTMRNVTTVRRLAAEK
jgi:uncharacterized protein (DUF1697 family)